MCQGSSAHRKSRQGRPMRASIDCFSFDHQVCPHARIPTGRFRESEISGDLGADPGTFLLPSSAPNHREAQYACICLQLLPMQQLVGLHLLHLSWRHSHALSYTVNVNLHCTRCALRADISQVGLRYNVQASDPSSLPSLNRMRMLSQLARLLICLCTLMLARMSSTSSLPSFCPNSCLPPALETLWQTLKAPDHVHVLNF